VFQVLQGRRETADVREEFAREFGTKQGRSGWAVVLTLAGLAVLVAGSRLMVAGAISLARALGVSDLVIGLTVVAVATSLPELATSVVAAAKGERDIAVGNIIGSNIFNLLAVLGLAAFGATEGVRVSPAALRFDLPVMLAVAVACLPVLASGRVVSRWEGALLLFYYAAYLLHLTLEAVDHGALTLLRLAMGWVILPLTVLVLSVKGLQSWRDRTGGA
jgi:cation:H+ antiporter